MYFQVSVVNYRSSVTCGLIILRTSIQYGILTLATNCWLNWSQDLQFYKMKYKFWYKYQSEFFTRRRTYTIGAQNIFYIKIAIVRNRLLIRRFSLSFSLSLFKKHFWGIFVYISHCMNDILTSFLLFLQKSNLKKPVHNSPIMASVFETLLSEWRCIWTLKISS